MKIRPNLFPQDGYIFTETDGTRLKSGSWRSLIKTIIDFRQRNRRAVGDPEQELIAQVCRRQPSICYDPGQKVQPGENTKISRTSQLKGRVMAWLNGLVKRTQKVGKPDMVPELISTARYVMCQRCPAVRIIPSGCSSCVKAIEAMRRDITGRVDRPGDLTACDYFGIDIPIATRLNGSDEDTAGAPHNCWRKKL